MYKQRIKDLVSWWMRRSVKRIELFCACKLGLDNIQKDEFVSELCKHAGLVTSDLTCVDQDGRSHIDMDMLGKLRSVIVPILSETFKNIPIPRIEDSNKSRDFWVDNIFLSGYEVMPINVRFQIESESNLNLREVETKYSSTKMIITLTDIQTELKDLEFYYKKKKFPEMSDRGRVTVRLTGNGATLKMIFRVVFKGVSNMIFWSPWQRA